MPTRLHENRPLHLHAVEPRNLADSYRRSIRIVPIDCQNKRRDMYGSAARAQRHGGIMKIFHWEGEPQQKLNTAITSQRTFQLIIQTTASTSVPPPLLLYGIPLHYTALIYGMATKLNRIRHRKPIISLSFPILPSNLDLPTRHFIFLYVFNRDMRDLG